MGLGSAQPYNVLVFGDFRATSSDTQGRLAAGGDVDLANYSVADQLAPSTVGATLIAGGDLSFTSGRLYAGDALVGGSAGGVSASVRNGLSATQQILDHQLLPIAFDSVRTEMRQLSAALASLPANGSVESQWGGLYLRGTTGEALQVFELPGDLVLQAHTFDVRDIPAGATVVFNIRGTLSGLTNMSLQSLAAMRQRVLFNFPDAVELTLAGISVEGSILAPDAVIQNPQGVVNGQVVAQRWDGMMQLNHQPFVGCLDTPASNRPPEILSTPERFAYVDRRYRYPVEAADPDEEVLSFGLSDAPADMVIDAASGLLQWLPHDGDLGVHAVSIQATDPHGANDQQSYDLRVVQDFCPIYPIALPSNVMDGLSPGAAVQRMPDGTGPGNYSWLTWTGANNSPTLAASLTPPGDSYLYVSPDDASDHVLNIGDWAQGAPGVKNASQVRAAMDVLLTQDIVLPVWSSRRGQGSQFDYGVQRFVTVRLTDYKLNGKGWLSFVYKGEATCYDRPPTADAQEVVTPEDTAAEIVLTGSDPEDSALVFIVVTGPEHGVLSGEAPNLVYEPEPGFFGEDAFEFFVNDGRLDSGTATVSISVLPVNDAPLADHQSIETDEDMTVAIVLTGSDSDSDVLTFSLQSQPAHGTLSGDAPDLSYAPNPDFHGVDSFAFVTNDGELNSDVATVSITVSPVNDAPNAVAQAVETNEDESLAIALIGSDPDGDALAFSVQSQPSNGTLTGDAPNLTYVPNADFHGADGFTFVANDGELTSNLATVSITVLPVNDAPLASDSTVQTNEDTPLTIALTGSDPDGDALTFSLQSPPSNGTLSGHAPDLTYTPNTDFHGADSFAFVTSDGELTSNVATVSIAVVPVNDVPSADSQSVETNEDTPLAVVLTGSDPDGDAVSFTVQMQPSHGLLSGDAPNLTYEPNADFHGADSFVFLSHDDELSSEAATVSITVLSVNDAPSADPLQLATPESTPLQITLTGSDRDGDALSYATIEGPAHGTLSGTAPDLVYMPTAGYDGEDGFTFQTHDGALDSEPALVSITVERVNAAPNAAPQSLSTDEGVALAITLTGSDPDGDALSFSVLENPAHGTLSGAAPELVYTPHEGFDGEDGLTFLVHDGEFNSSPARVDIVVRRVRHGPTIVSSPVTAATQSQVYSYDVDATDPDQDTLVYTLDRAPAAIAIESESGLVQGLVDADLVQTVRAFNGQCYVLPDGAEFEGSDGTAIAPLYQRVRGAISRGSAYAAPQTRAWHEQNECLGCHIQNQTLLGLQGSLSRADIDEDTAEFLLTEVMASQQADGSILRSNPNYAVNQTALAVWALSHAPDRARTFEVRERALRFLLSRVTRFRDQYAWRKDTDTGWLKSNTAATALVVLGIDRYIRDAARLPNVTAEQMMLALELRNTVSGAARHFLDRDPLTTDNLAMSLVLMGLAQTRAHIDDAALRALVDSRIAQLDARLRERVQVDGGWPYIVGGHSDPLTTAWVGFALDTLDPPADDPIVLAGIEYLLNAQVGDGTWRTYSGLFTTHLATTGLVMAYLPVALEHLGSADLSLGHMRIQVLGDGSIALSVEAMNRGLADTDASSTVTFFSGRDLDGEPLGEATVPALRSGEAQWASITLDTLPAGEVSAGIASVGLRECIENNNATRATLVSVRATDPDELFDTQSFLLNLEDANAAPTISSVPVTELEQGKPYEYQVAVIDPDVGDAFEFELRNAPLGLYINPLSGKFYYDVQQLAAGTHTITVRVTDLRGLYAEQTFQLDIAPNHQPVIVSTPPTSASVGEPYTYRIEATDQDEDDLFVSLPVKPIGMTLDEATSQITWTPTAAQSGSQAVQVRVVDGRGGGATQSFSVVVSQASNQLPTITSTPVYFGKTGRSYRYAATATDPDGDAIVWSLPSSPADMTVDAATGEVLWTPANTGSFAVTLRAADAQGYREQSWAIEVIDGLLPMTAELTVNPQPAAPGGELLANLTVENPGGAVTVVATLDGAPITLLVNATTTLIAPTEFGPHTLVAQVSDGEETVEIVETIYVADPSDTTPPDVQIMTPAEHPQWDAVEITAPTAVRAFVHGDDVSRWVLAVTETGVGAPSVLVEGDTAFNASEIATFDPTLLENGLYTLTLQAWDGNGNTAFDSRQIMVTGDMKLGHFSITFEEVSVPVAGIPVTVTRTYDTRRARKSLDFGYGWTVDATGVRLQESRRPGLAWTAERNGGPLSTTWCFAPLGAPMVTVRLPDGGVAKFRAKAVPECQDITLNQINLAFEDVDGYGYELEQTDYGLLTWGNVEGFSVPILYDGAGPPVPANPQHYKLTTPEGMVYTIDQDAGLKRVDDPGSNQFLTFSRDGVLHSTGVGIVFERDALGRIHTMRMPDDSTRHYAYTPQGELDQVVDQVGEITSFGYVSTPAFPHYLRDIVDPRGVRVSRNEYDDDGRLVATIDADGERIEYDHQIDGRAEVITDRRGFAMTYVYDEEGRVLSETNGAGETTLRTYDTDGNELTTTNALNETTARTFDGRFNLLTETNAAGERTTHTYNGKNQLLTQTDHVGRPVLRNTFDPRSQTLLTATKDALGNETAFAYVGGTGIFGTGQLESITDAEGQQTGFAYDVRGYKTSEVDALGRPTVFINDDMGRVIEERRFRTRADGSNETLSTFYTYDAKGNVTAVTHPDGSVTTTEYDGNDKPVRECDGLNRCTTTSYDDRGNVVRIQYPDGLFDEKQYDPNGNLAGEIDRAGRGTWYQYDGANRLVRTTFPDGTFSRSVYDDAGRMLESIDENGRVTQYRYDAAGRQTEVLQADPASGVAGAGPVMRTLYDETGRRTASIDPNGGTTRYVYDDAGRLIETVFPDPQGDDGDDGNNPRTRTDYDKVGRKLAETDEAGRTTRYAYDALGRLVAVVLPNPQTGANPPLVSGQSPDAGTLTTTYAYDQVGNKIAQTDAEGRTTRWEYDAMGRETARVLPGGQRETKAYNAAGELVTMTDFNGVTTGYAYDVMGRLQHIDYSHDADVTTQYDQVGRRGSVSDARGPSSWSYDARGRVLQSIDADGHVIEYQYDSIGNLVARISPSQSLVYQHDALNRIVSVTRTVDGEAPMVTRYEYDAAGNRKAMLGGDGTRTDYGYDARHRLRNLVKTTALGALLVGMSYDVDASGMRTAVEEYDAAGTIRTVEYDYDGVKRLIEERIDHRDDLNDRVSSWSYDRVGNRLTQVASIGPAGAVSTATTTYGYDGNDRLLTETTDGLTTTYTYDANGNTKSKAGPDGATSYDYDDANRLVEATTPEAVAEYVYNADGLRVRQSVTPSSGAGAGTTTTTWYVQDAGYAYAQVIEQYESVGGGTRRLSGTYTFADDLVSQTRYDENGTPETAFVQMDGFGSTRWVTDQSGNITDSIDYDAFGNEIARSGTTEVEHLYRGEAFDPNVGFYYLRARWMDPSVGRFVTKDAFAGFGRSPQSLHKYQYANDDPVNGVDPSGYMTMIELSTAERAAVQMVMSQVKEYGFDVVSRSVMNAFGGNMKVSAPNQGNAAGAGLLTSLALACKASKKSCLLKGIPVFISGFSAVASSIHIAMAQLGNGNTSKDEQRPLPFFLLRGLGRDDVDPRRGKKGCPGNLKSAVCDEYPFASSLQGGNSKYKDGLVSLMWVPRREGPKQGGEISGFYNSQKVYPSTPFMVTGIPFMPTSYITRGGDWKPFKRQ
ncbi:MAG: tandem-95 repeat protein [Xanthomonadales bacterium]|nr:tandem-95 repeat protein [Xanthomonadales bacterium]